MAEARRVKFGVHIATASEVTTLWRHKNECIIIDRGVIDSACVIDYPN